MINHLLYIDPGSGSLLFQIIIAGLLGVMFFFRTTFEKIKLITKIATTRFSSISQTAGTHPFLIGLFFVLYKAKEVFILYDFFTVIFYTAAIMAISGLLLTGLFIATKNIIKSAIILSAFLLIALFYESIYQFILSATIFQYLHLKIGHFIVFVFLTLSSFIWISEKNFSRFNSYLNILFMILVLTEAGTAAYNHFTNRPFVNLMEEKNYRKHQSATCETPAIYHILLDAYTSSASLKKYMNYNNAELENFLRNNGFYIADKATSNTTATQQSMATTFNMCYLHNMDSIFNNDLLSTSVYRNLINHSRLAKELTSRNYSLINLSIFDIGDSSKFHRAGILADATDFFQLLIDGTRFASLIKSTPYIDFKSNLAVFDRLKKIPKSTDIGKTFVYAHINMPHDAYCDSNGNPFSSTYTINENEKYKETLAYTNKLLTETVKTILSESKIPPVIIIHGDHGSRMFDESEKYTVLSAYYFPDKDYSLLYDSISLVNTYRVICRKYFKENINLLPDQKGCRKF